VRRRCQRPPRGDRDAADWVPAGAIQGRRRARCQCRRARSDSIEMRVAGLTGATTLSKNATKNATKKLAATSLGRYNTFGVGL